ncbi:MAG: LamG domain-containing protein, partial [Planctomycetota bacterium]|nr:LamG domain-containing protein [Planctomycetota bacterium]
MSRTFNIGPRSRDLVLQVAHRTGARIDLRGLDGTPTAGRQLAVFVDDSKPAREGTDDGGGAPTNLLEFDGESSLEVAGSPDFDLRTRDFTIYARLRTRRGGTIFAKAPRRGEWATDGKTLFVRDGRLCYDIGWVGVVQSRKRVNDGRWHEVAVTYDHEKGVVRLHVDGEMDRREELRPGSRGRNHVVRLGYTSPDFPESGGFRGQLADVRFYSRRLETAEFRRLKDKDAETRDESLVARWDDRSRGKTLRDLSGNGHHARRRAIRGEDTPPSYPLVFDGDVFLEVEGSEQFDLTGKDF